MKIYTDDIVMVLLVVSMACTMGYFVNLNASMHDQNMRIIAPEREAQVVSNPARCHWRH